MKNLIVLFFMLMSLKSFSQISYSFENGTTEGWSFQQEGRWAADAYQAINGIYSLHHIYNNASAATDAASFSLEGLCLSCQTVTWSFYIRHGYAPSASNKWAFVLSSDLNAVNLITSTGFNGFVTGVNLTGNDDTLRLWSVSSKTITAVITSSINWEKDIGTSGSVRVTVTKEGSGIWTLGVYKTDGTLLGSWQGNSTSAPSAMSSGIIYSYTATADQLLWIDDVSVSGTFIPDTAAPKITSVRALSLTKVRVVFDEDLQGEVMIPGNVSLSSGIAASTAVRISEGIYDINFQEPLNNKQRVTLIITGLCDKSGNCSNVITADFTPAFAEPGDVIISEIMFDPSPPVGLPDDEYVEIFNPTQYDFISEGWMLIVGSDTSFMPATTIRRNEFAILCSSSDTSEFRPYGKAIGLKSFPGLNDTGEKIALRDGEGQMIHALKFGPELYNDDLRSGGGWSVEMTDFTCPFNTENVWCASHDKSGGTPGKANSVQSSGTDNECPRLITVYPSSDNSIVLQFNETMKGAFNPGGFVSGNSTALRVLSNDITDMSFFVEFEEPFSANTVYNLSFPSSLSDYSGNKPCHQSVNFAIPVEAEAGEILFNELLFNPVSPCEDFIELYNNSSSVFNLSDYYFSSTDPETGKESVVCPVCSFPKLLLPGELIALTVSRDALLNYYHCSSADNITETAKLPSMPDDKGIITLYSKSLGIIDRVEYNSSMHLLFISDDEGVSLEKVNPSLPSGIAANWHSASESCFWGTPGAVNSVLDSIAGETVGVTLSAERVSPDGDGYEDVVSVNVFPGGEDNVVSVKIFNDGGSLVRSLSERFYAGKGAFFIWDGTGNDGHRLKRGLYLIIVTSYNPGGTVKRWKKVCAVLYD